MKNANEFSVDVTQDIIYTDVYKNYIIECRNKNVKVKQYNNYECIVCGDSFLSIRKRRYCDVCSVSKIEHKKDFLIKIPRTRICSYCNKEFLSIGRKKYCENCSIISNRRKHKIGDGLLCICCNCKKEFTHNRTKKYCGDCSTSKEINKRHKLKIKLGIDGIYVCLNCGNEFKYNRKRKYCESCIKNNVFYKKRYSPDLEWSEWIERRKKRSLGVKKTYVSVRKKPILTTEEKIINRKLNYIKIRDSGVLKIYMKAYYNKNISRKIALNLRNRIWVALKRNGMKKSKSFKELCGCDVDSLAKHIESQFTKGMTWKNHGRYGWHVDHIIPCSKFDLSDIEQQKQCFHYTNLQPLWWQDNIFKSDKLITPQIKLLL